MRNKTGVIVLTVIISLLCVYYLSFTFVSNRIQKTAETYATNTDGTIDFAKKQGYLDSIWKEPVYNLVGIKYTFEEVKETELNLGLDLRGGMHVTLEVSPVDILKGLSGNNEDPDFLEALELARERQRNSQERFTDLFYQAFQETAPNKKLSSIFANAANRGRISYDSSDEEVLDILTEEVDGAIDRAFQILRTRIDRFGTSQPNIQKLQSGRIQIELPGVDNPERVRNLLQGVAKLEFLEVYQFQEYASSLEAINTMLVEEQQAATETLATETESQDDMAEASDDLSSLTTEPSDEDTTTTDENDLESQLSGTANDTTGLDSLSNFDNQVSPLLSLLQSAPQYGLVYTLEDTTRINRILNREDVQSLLPANLEFAWDVKPRIAENGTELMELYPLKRGRGGEAPLTGEVITEARQDYDESTRPAVSMQMNAEGARKWRRLTADNVGRRIAVVLDGYVYTAPNVINEIPNGSSEITGNFTIEEAQDLSNILKAGALPAPTRIVEEAIIGPTLGQEAIRQGVISIVAGLVIVVVFMIAYYAKGGLIANLALVFNVFFILGILAQLNAALTLPGVAGIVLTIGMSIDANVLIFERIREELRNGVKIKAAIDAGYSKAYSSIIDSNATTFLTGVILYTFGQGPVKGFAVTLMIGIACSFFSAVFLSRVFVEWMSRRGDESKISFATPFSNNLLTNLNIDFLSKRKIAYIISASFIAIGIVLIFIQGGLNLGVDFTGGRSYVLSFNDPVVASDLRTELTDDFESSGVEVKTFGANNVLKVTTSYMVDDESTEADEQVRQALINGVEDFTSLSFSANESGVDGSHFTILSSSKVGATIADDIRNASWRAIIFSLIVIFLYILIRFRKWQYSLGAVIALAHDTLAVLGAFAIMRMLGISYEVDQVFIAAMLTIIGYSINDTVIVFDRIRENLSSKPSSDMVHVFNTAINNVMTRTLITSFTTLVVVIILFLFGGEVLRGFSFALLMGILIGTYSSIYIASPIVIDLGRKAKADTPKTAKA